MAQPNIVLLLADDMGYGDISHYGTSRFATPNMDYVARRGMTFTDMHSTSAVCTPSRYGLFTGRYCWRTWLQSFVLGGFGAPLIEPQRPTLASVLKG
ncbi:MAG: sulfatase-like hydrolase/transferase, partial [Spirochaetales bacterium]|nr:sulfatase-like hydrolase/transferase [Spirochaetales bacterium]